MPVISNVDWDIASTLESLSDEYNAAKNRIEELESALADAEDKIKELEQQVEDLINNG